MSASLPKLSVSQLSLYNPMRMSDEEIVASFAARQDVLERLLADIRAEKPLGRPQHHLIVGQRGMGKSTLLARLAAELRGDPRLAAQFIPLAFAEEQYAVDRLSKFWLNCLDSLADASERAGDTAATERIDEAVRRLAASLAGQTGQDEGPAEAALEAFLAEARAVGRRPVLLVDNLQLVFERISDQQAHVLRELLMRQGAPLLVGASPSPPQQSQDYGAAFYDHFKVHYLRPLSVEEMRELLLKLAQTVDRPDIRRNVLLHPHRLSVLRQLTGGNPRTTVTLFFLYAEDFAPAVFGDLENLLDRVTPLYKARFEELSPQQQVIASAVGNHWDPVTARSLVEVTSLPVSAITPNLDRLEKVGFVERVDLFGESSMGFQIAERFFNVWFLMRSASRRQRREVEFLTRFIESFYEAKDRVRLARQLQTEHELSPDRHLLTRALACTLSAADAHDLRRHAELDALRQRESPARRRLEEVIDFSHLPATALAFDELREKLVRLVPAESGVEPGEFCRKVLGDREMFRTGYRNRLAATNRLSADQVEKLAARLDSARETEAARFGPKAVEWLAQRLESGQLASPDNLEDWTTAFCQAPDPNSVHLLLSTIPASIGPSLSPDVVRRLQRDTEPGAEKPALGWFNWGYALHRILGRGEGAEAAYRQAITLDQNFALPWNGLGNLLQDHLGRCEEAEAAYRQAILLDQTFAWPWENLGRLLHYHLSRYEEAEVAYRQAIALDQNWAEPWNDLGDLLQFRLSRYEDAEAAYRQAIAVDERSALPWFGLGYLIQYRLGRYEEAEAAYRRAIALDEKSALPWSSLGTLLQYRLGRYEEAEAAYRQAIALDEKFAVPWSGLGALLQDHLGRYEEAEAAYRQAIALDEKSALPWSSLGTLLQYRLGRYEDAEAAYRQAIALDEKSALPWSSLGTLLQYCLGRYEDAEAAYRQAIALDGKSALPWIGLGDLLHYHLSRYEEAETAYRRAIALDEKSAWPWFGLGALLQDHLGRYEEAEAAYRQAIALDEKSALPWSGLGDLLQDHLGRYEEAEAAYRQAITLDQNFALPWNGLGALLQDHLGRYEEAETAYREALARDPKDITILVDLGNLCADFLHKYDDAEGAFAKALEQDPESEYAIQSLIWLRRDFRGDVRAAAPLLERLSRLEKLEDRDLCHLHRAVSAAYESNWGTACQELGNALQMATNGIPADTADGWMRASAVLLHLNYGEPFLAFLRERGDHARLRPWYEALAALHAGDRRNLQNVAPEVRTVAEAYYDQIEKRLNHLPEQTRRRPAPAPPKRRAGGRKRRRPA